MSDYLQKLYGVSHGLPSLPGRLAKYATIGSLPSYTVEAIFSKPKEEFDVKRCWYTSLGLEIFGTAIAIATNVAENPIYQELHEYFGQGVDLITTLHYLFQTSLGFIILSRVGDIILRLGLKGGYNLYKRMYSEPSDLPRDIPIMGKTDIEYPPLLFQAIILQILRPILQPTLQKSREIVMKGLTYLRPIELKDN